MKKAAKEGSYVHEKTRPESHRFEECYTNPKSDDFKVEVYCKRMRWMVENHMAIADYMQPSMLHPADVQHCIAEGLMELAAPAEQCPALPPPPPPTTVVAPTSRAPVAGAPIAAEGGVT